LGWARRESRIAASDPAQRAAGVERTRPVRSPVRRGCRSPQVRRSVPPRSMPAKRGFKIGLEAGPVGDPGLIGLVAFVDRPIGAPQDPAEEAPSGRASGQRCSPPFRPRSGMDRRARSRRVVPRRGPAAVRSWQAAPDRTSTPPYSRRARCRFGRRHQCVPVRTARRAQHSVRMRQPRVCDGHSDLDGFGGCPGDRHHTGFALEQQVESLAIAVGSIHAIARYGAPDDSRVSLGDDSYPNPSRSIARGPRL